MGGKAVFGTRHLFFALKIEQSHINRKDGNPTVPLV